MNNHLLKIFVLFPLAIFSQAGIGTTTPDPSSILDVTASDKGVLVPRVAIANLNTAAPVTSPVESLLVYNTTVGTGVGFHYWDGAKWIPLAGAAGFDTDWTVVGNDMYSANTGNVGVGTTTPSILMHIEDTGAPAVRVVNGFEAVGLVLTSDASGYVSWGQPTLDNDWTISGNDMYNGNAGNVGIGTTAPIEPFHVVSDRILLESTGNAVLRSKKGDWDTSKWYDLIGMYTDPGFDPNAIYIGGYNASNTNADGYDNGNKVYLGWDGATQLELTATAFNVSSSRRAKKNISISQYGLKEILKIKPVKYQYKTNTSGLYTIGFIAEQVSEIIPEVVSHQDDKGNVVSREEGKPVSMDYSKMNAVLVNAVKEQQLEIDVLEQENSVIEKQIIKLESLLL
jgi:hypothetical protein